MRHTQLWTRVAVIASIFLLSLIAILKMPASAQGEATPREIFKVRYGTAQGQIVALPEKFPPLSDGNEEEEPEPDQASVWPASFCVSWDGQLFYIDDSARMLLLKEKTELRNPELGEKSPPNPFVQVYDRQGQWVRAIEITHGDPYRMRVGADGKLYVQGEDGAEVYNPDGTYNKTLSERIQAAVRSTYAPHNLCPGFCFLWEVDREGRCYFLMRRIIEREVVDGEERTVGKLDRLLIVSPDGTVNILPVVTYDPFAVNRYTGQVLVADYSVLPPHEDERIWTLYDEREQRKCDEAVFDVMPELTFRWFTPDGGVVGSIRWRLDVSVYLPNVWNAYNGARNWHFQIPVLFDQQGRIYKLYTRQQQRRRYLYTNAERTEGTRLIDGFWIVEFDSQGRFSRARARDIVLEVDIRSRTLWDVDREGNVYWLDFQPDHLRVMMAPRQ